MIMEKEMLLKLPLTKEKITLLIPHREPVIMIDSLEDHTGNYAATSFKIEKDNVFLRDNQFQEAGLIENMAQTAAAWAGWHFLQNKMDLPLFYIASVNNLKINKYPVLGDTVETRTEIKTTVLKMTLIKGEIVLNGEQIATCDMMIIMEDKKSI